LLYVGTSIGLVIFPSISGLIEDGNLDGIKRAVELAYNVCLLVMLPLVVASIIFAEKIITLLFGAEYVAAAWAFKILCVGCGFHTYSVVNFGVLNGLKRPGVAAKIMLWGASINILLNYVLIFYWGLLGAAIATTLVFLVMGVWSTWHVFFKELPKPLNT